MSKKSKIKPQSDFRKDDKCGCTRFDGRRVEDEDVRRAIRDFLHQEHARLPRPPEDLQTLQHFRERVDRCWCQLQQHGSLEERLSGACDYLQDEIVWETGTGERVIYRGWTDQQKDRIDELFQLLLENRRDLGLRCPDPSRNYPRNMRPGGLTANMFFTAEEAFDIYAAHVAHVFYIEATQAVPWSIFSIPTVELAELISSDRYHSRIVPSHLMSVDYYPSQIQPNRDFQLPDRAYYGVGLVSDPRIGYSFLNGMNSSARQNLIGATEEETMQNLTLWFSTNVLHGSVDIQLEYPSYCVLNRNFLQDRLKRETISRFSHRQKGIIQPWGCQSASNLFHDLARSVNIPILWVWTCEPIPDSNEYNGHAGLLYHWERSDARLLYHTDDIYLQQLAPFFPSVHDQNVFIERQATDRERAQTYFNTQWAPLSVLESWGFQITYEFSLLPNPHAGIANDDEPNLGVVACTWPPAERGLGGYVSYLLENRYQLGTWMKYLDGYCGYLVWRTQGNNMPTYAASPYGANIQSEASSHSRPLREFEERALACITAYGGCDQLRVLVQEFWDHYGSNTWVKRDQKSMKKRKLPERFRKRRNH